jgi:SAM-dependent methyltransferase
MDTSDFRDRVKEVASPARQLARRALSVPSGGEYVEAVAWFNARINSVAAHATTIEDQVNAICEIANDLRVRVAALAEQSHHTADRQGDTLESLLAAGQRTSRVIEALGARLDDVEREALDLQARSRELAERADNMSARVDATDDTVRDLAHRVDALADEQQRNAFELTGRIYLASPHLLDVKAPDGRATLGFDSMTPLGGADYRSLEDVFRGPEEFIKERLRAYLRFFEPGEEAVDLGSGRGEMLELLAEAGVDALGVDLDASMVGRVEAKGLRCTRSDALEWLGRREKKSLDVVFSAQFLEHLPTSALADLLGAARDCLRPGGRLIAETVNPYCPSALRAFWVDPTHIHPLYPETLLVLLHQAGFTSAYVVYPTSEKEPEIARTEAGEYAIVATT